MGNKSAILISSAIIITAIAIFFQPKEAVQDTRASGGFSGNGMDFASLEQLRSQLETALSSSGGISPQTYEEAEKKIQGFESQGYPRELTEELRALLSQFTIGGRENSGSGPGIQPENSTGPGETISNGPEPGISQRPVIWHYFDGKWRPNGEPPECPDPLVLESPVDLSLATSILYPGQVRGTDFKPHGGFRTDGTTGPVRVAAPLEGYIYNVARFHDSLGIHYMLDVQHSCGIMYRLGHLGAVPPKIEAIFDSVPENGYDDSRTHEIDPAFVGLGETIATDIQHGSGFDWGVYDLRQENKASQDPAFREEHKDEPWQAYYAVCWFDYLPADQRLIVESLPPGDGISGRMSAYC